MSASPAPPVAVEKVAAPRVPQSLLAGGPAAGPVAALAPPSTSGSDAAQRRQTKPAHVDGDGFRFDLAEGTLDLDRAGAPAALTATGKRLNLVLAAGHPKLTLDLSEGALTLDKLGAGHSVAAGGSDVHLGVGDWRLDLGGVLRIEIETDGQSLARGRLVLDGTGTLAQQGSSSFVFVRDASATVERNGVTRMELSIAEAGGLLTASNTGFSLHGLDLETDGVSAVLILESAALYDTLGRQFGGVVEDVQVTLLPGGGLRLTVGAIDARVGDVAVTLRTDAGERVRLHIEPGGEPWAELEIPKHGWIRLEQGDLRVQLGPQTVRFEGSRVRIDGVNIDVATANALVEARGGSVQVALDPASGRLVIEEIHGTELHVAAFTTDLRLDIERLDGFIFELTGVRGATRSGMRLDLIPTHDGSRLAFELHAMVGGVPFLLSVADAHRFTALIETGANEVHAYLAAERGKMALDIGPFAFKGSVIDILARYHPADVGRMHAVIGQFLRTDGLQLGRSIRLQSDGALRFGVAERSGIDSELTVLLPVRGGKGAAEGDGSFERARFGFMVSLGGKAMTRSGRFYRAGVGVGLVPASFLELRLKGVESIGGIPIPGGRASLDLPTTAAAFVHGTRKTPDGTLTAMLGVYANLLAGAESGPFVEPVSGGAVLGAKFRSDRTDWDASAVSSRAKTGESHLSWRVGITARFGGG